MRRAPIFVALALGVAIGWVLLLPAWPIAQPVAFNHARHGGLACAVCHRGVETSSRAGLPDGGVCAKCHATPPRGEDPARWEEFLAPDGARWVRVTRVPDHVLFSHRRHVSLARLECSSCHGDIGRRVAPPARAPVRLDMSGCLSCHRREGASEDCAACHR
ncbi:MAG TPA: cytochrome c3 family protein [Vicinamibacterales bacterium]|nr:cytochrome c3 family protein [Vicinamibacterales bacterium]